MRMPEILAHDRTFTQPVVWLNPHHDCVSYRRRDCFVLLQLAGIFARDGLVVGRRRPWCGRRIPSASYTSRLQNVQVGGTFSDRMRHTGSGRWPDFLGCYASPALPEHRQGRRPTFSARSGFWAHVGWLLTGQTMHNDSANLLAYVPDLRKAKFHVWISRWHWIPITILGVVLLLLGGWKFLL
jgi:hypothetical protein